jgi:hypothetical protein
MEKPPGAGLACARIRVIEIMRKCYADLHSSQIILKISIGKTSEFRSYQGLMRKQSILLMGLMALSLPLQAEENETPLAKQMDAMNDAFKIFRKETDPVKGAAQAREAQQAALKSLLEIPERVKAMPEGPEKAKAVVAYHKMLGRLYVTLCEVEDAFLNGKMDEVAKMVDSIKEMKKSGHDQFMEEE